MSVFKKLKGDFVGQEIIFNWGEFLGKRASYVLKHMGYVDMTAYPRRGNDAPNDYVVFDYSGKDILFFVRGGLVVEIRFLQKHPEKVFNFTMGLSREEVEAIGGKPNKILKASEIGFQTPFEHVLVYSDMRNFDFTLEVLFDASWVSNQINIYP